MRIMRIIIGYNLNNFFYNTHIAIIIVDDGKIYNFKISKRIPELITGGSLIMKQI
jgi:hypothetical protein